MNKRLSVALLSVLPALAFHSSSLLAADAVWSGGTAAANWNNNAKWNPASAPGALFPTLNNQDTATLGTATLTITVDSGRNIKNIVTTNTSGTITLTGGSFLLSNGGSFSSSTTGSTTHNLTVNSNITLVGDYSFTSNGTSTGRQMWFNGQIDGAATTGNTAVLTLDGTNAGGTGVFRHWIGGLITDGTEGGRLAIAKNGASKWSLGNANTFTGNTTVSGGSLNLIGSNAVQNSTLVPNGGSVVFDSSVSSHAFTVGGLSGSNNLILRDNAATPNPVALSVGGGTVDVTSSYSGVLSGAGSLIKVRAGTFIVSGANTYTGVTTVNDGKLVINGNNGAATGAVTVQTGGTLGGSGTVGGATTIKTASFHSPGNSPGLQTFTNGLTYETGSTLNWELAGNQLTGRGSVFDGIDVTGGTLTIQTGVTANLLFNGLGSTVDWSDSFWSTDRQWLVYDNANLPGLGSPTNIFDTLNVSVDAQGDTLTTGTFSFGTSGNDIVLNYTYTPVPEPGSLSSVLLGLTLLGFVLRGRTIRTRRI